MANMTYAQFKKDYYRISGEENDKEFLIVYTKYTDGLDQICRTVHPPAEMKRLLDDWEETNMSGGALIAARCVIARWECIRQECHGEKATTTPYVNESLAQATKVRKSVTDDASILLNKAAAKANRGCQHTKACLLGLAHAFARELNLDK